MPNRLDCDAMRSRLNLSCTRGLRCAAVGVDHELMCLQADSLDLRPRFKSGHDRLPPSFGCTRPGVEFTDPIAGLYPDQPRRRCVMSLLQRHFGSNKPSGRCPTCKKTVNLSCGPISCSARSYQDLHVRTEGRTDLLLAELNEDASVLPVVAGTVATLRRRSHILDVACALHCCNVL